jgi:hypothetical protein
LYNFGHRKGISTSVLVIILAIGKGDPIVKNPTSCITLNVDNLLVGGALSAKL